MKNKILFFLTLVISISLIGCTVENDYTLQGIFSNKLSEEILVESSDGKLTVEIPITDFSCDVESFKTSLDRKQDTFIITLTGDETSDRCSRNFTGTVSEIKNGEYWIEVIYEKGNEKQKLLSERFFMK